MNKVFMFLREVRAELEKVTWPSKDDLIGSLIIVSILSLFFAAVLGAMDAGITKLIQWLIR